MDILGNEIPVLAIHGTCSPQLSSPQGVHSGRAELAAQEHALQQRPRAPGRGAGSVAG